MAAVEVITARQMEQFDKMLLDNPDMKKKVKKILSSVLSHVRKELQSDAHAIIVNDPRATYKAVKYSIYKRILGGNVSILDRKKASNVRVSVKHESVYDKEPWHRGGNRRKRSSRTEQIDSYYGADRGFILRFLNAGTRARSTRYGNRGSITGQNWFGRRSQYVMQEYSQEFCDLIDYEIKQVLKTTD